jgi:hypothetical protein
VVGLIGFVLFLRLISDSELGLSQIVPFDSRFR